MNFTSAVTVDTEQTFAHWAVRMIFFLLTLTALTTLILRSIDTRT